jgi:hypothetical protein
MKTSPLPVKGCKIYNKARLLCTKSNERIWIFLLIDYLLFYVSLKNISLIWRRHHYREGLQNLGLCSALRVFEQGGIFIVLHLLWHGTSVFPVSFEGPPHLITSYDSHGDAEDLHSYPDPHGSPFNRLLRHATGKGVLRTYFYPGPHWLLSRWYVKVASR